MQSTDHPDHPDRASSPVGREREPHVPYDRLGDGTWVHAPYGAMLPIEDGTRIVCHVCGDALTLISAQHAARHGLTQAGYRERFGLNRKASLAAPALAEKRRVQGRRRWAENPGVREGLGIGQQMARSGVLYEFGAAAQPAGARRSQGRAAASREGASPALRADRARRSAAARARWDQRARELGFTDLEEYLDVRLGEGASSHRVRVELGCGGSVAARLVALPRTDTADTSLWELSTVRSADAVPDGLPGAD